jgi:two-component system OmpR family sensor kinase
MWMLLAVGYSLRGIGRRRPLLAWSGLMMLGLAVADLGLVSADRPAHVWIVGSGSVRLVALLLAMFGGALELERAFVEQRARLLDIEISARTNETRWRLHQAHEQDRDHDLRSALVAIEGAALTLERHYDTLTDLERDRLTSMLSSGVDRLQHLLVQEGRPRASFALADVVRPFVGNLVAEGETVDVAVPDDMVAYGSPAETAEVVRQLLDNARRRAPGGTITVRGEQEGQAVVLRVDDQGQLAGGDRAGGAIRPPETVPAETPEGLPVALHVASRLMREQGGDLWVEAQSSGRSSFALSLPAPTLGPASLS